MRPHAARGADVVRPVLHHRSPTLQHCRPIVRLTCLVADCVRQHSLSHFEGDAPLTHLLACPLPEACSKTKGRRQHRQSHVRQRLHQPTREHVRVRRAENLRRPARGQDGEPQRQSRDDGRLGRAKATLPPSAATGAGRPMATTTSSLPQHPYRICLLSFDRAIF